MGIVKGELEKAYLAGFFDGEGCIWIGRSGVNKAARAYYSMQVSVGQKYRGILERYVDIWGGNITLGSACPNWRPPAKNAARFLKDLLPYLQEKRAQAIVGIVFDRRKRKKQLTRDQQIKCHWLLKRWKRIPPEQQNLAELRLILRKENGNS